MLSELRRILRSLLKSPGYSLIALLTLALGIGVNSSMFSVVDALLFRGAPYPGADRLVQLMAAGANGESRPFSFLELGEIRERKPEFESLTTLNRTAFALAEPGRPSERIAGAMVSSDFFATFQVVPRLGRVFAPEEYEPGKNQVVLLSHGFWQERYGGAADVVGRTLRLDGQVVTVIGVMPPSFDYPALWGRAAFWRPLNFTREQMEWRDYRVFDLVGRLPTAARSARLRDELATVLAEQARRFPESYSHIRYRVLPLHQALMDSLSRQVSLMLLGLSGVVLLIACANLANLQLARAVAGIRQLAIRAALGASRARLMREQVLQSVVLSLAGGALGLALAFTLNRIVDRSLSIGGGSDGLGVRLDGQILLLTFGVALLTGVLFGAVPAWFASRTDVSTTLKQQGRGSSAGRGHHLVRQALIVAEVALALTLLAGAGILHRGFAKMLERQTGWETDRIITAALPIPETRKEYETESQRGVLFEKLERQLASLPGVEHAALATSLPIFSYNGDRQLVTESQAQGDRNLPAAFHVMVSSDYFATVGIHLLEGRLFPRGMKESDPRVIVINQALARRLWPAGGAVGRRIGSMDSGTPYWAEVIGVVADVHGAANTRDPATPFQIYKPLVHEPWSNVQLVLRGPAPASLAESLSRAVAAVDPDLAATGVGTVWQIVGWQHHNLVLAGRLLTAFALLGLLLAAVGLYGVISNAVAQRTGEFGIRIALGARPPEVLWLVLRQGLGMSLIGVLVGLFGAFYLGRVLVSFMPRLASLDPVVFASVAGVLLAVAVVACWVPARRATRVDPLTALRTE